MIAGLLATALTLAVASVPSVDTVRDWSWINGTTWYVPKSGLPAYLYSPTQNRLVPIQDQTVYTITGYRNGYFWGTTAAQIDENDITCKSLVGSVTPEGSIYLTFTDYPHVDGSTTTIGLGNMVQKAGQWTMANQMSTGSSSAQVGHWAYMVQSKPGDASWASLPGVDTSVPDFTAPCKDAAPITPD